MGFENGSGIAGNANMDQSGKAPCGPDGSIWRDGDFSQSLVEAIHGYVRDRAFADNGEACARGDPEIPVMVELHRLGVVRSGESSIDLDRLADGFGRRAVEMEQTAAGCDPEDALRIQPNALDVLRSDRAP